MSQLLKSQSLSIDNDAIVFSSVPNVKGLELKSLLKVILKKVSNDVKREKILQEYDIVGTTIEVITSRKGMDHLALAILIFVSAGQRGASLLYEKGANKLVLEMIQKSARNEKRTNYWVKEKSKESKSLVYLHKISQYPESAVQLKELGAIETLNKIMDFGPQIAIDAALAIVLIEAKSSYEEIFIFPLITSPERFKHSQECLEFLIGGIASALDLTIRGLNGTNFTFGRYSLETLVSAMQHLVKDDACRSIVLRDAFVVVRMLFRLLQDFHQGAAAPTVAGIGGGGSDVTLAEAEISTLSSLLVTELARDDELCERLIARGLATLLIAMYERPDSNFVEPDEDGPCEVLRLSCWMCGHQGDALLVLPRPGSSLKVTRAWDNSPRICHNLTRILSQGGRVGAWRGGTGLEQAALQTAGDQRLQQDPRASAAG